MSAPAVTFSNMRIPSLLNLAIVAAQLVAIGLCVACLKIVNDWWSLLILAFLFGIVMNSVYSIIHEAEHGILFTNRRLNDFAGAFMALFFPAPFHLIRQGHLGHHLRNRSDDEAFDFYFEGDHKIWKFMVFYGILTGFYYVIVVLSNLVFLLLPFHPDKKYLHVDQASKAFLRSLNPEYRSVIRFECLCVLLLHGTIIWLGGIPLASYVIIYAGFGLMWSSLQYVHHYGTERHITRGARNLWIWKPLDWIWLNHNWHLEHHERPSVPWIYLASTEVADDRKPGFLLAAYLRMWRGPKRALESVRNPSADKIIP